MNIVDSLQNFIDRNAAYLTVRHGAGLPEAELKRELERLDIKLPRTVREVLTRWGWLELMVSKDVWPHTMFADGLQFFGFGDAPTELSLEHHLRRFDAAVDAATFFRFNNQKGLRGRTPVFGTLEGLQNSWAANSRSVKWFNDYASRWDEILRDEGTNTDHPMFDVSDADDVAALLLQRLGYRIERARMLGDLSHELAELGSVEVDGAQVLRTSAHPDVRWMVRPHDSHPVVRAVLDIGVVDNAAVAAVQPAATPVKFDRAFPDARPIPHEAWLTFPDAVGIGARAAAITAVLTAAGELARGDRDALDTSDLPPTIVDFSRGARTRWLAWR